MKITTDSKPRQLVCFDDLDTKWQQEFDYITEERLFEDRFVLYRGWVYDVYDTQRIARRSAQRASYVGWEMLVDDDDPLSNWDTVISDSYFSGVLFKFVGDDQVICGRYTC